MIMVNRKKCSFSGNGIARRHGRHLFQSDALIFNVA